jgi:acetyl-CoA C-acetyltransferase
MRDVWVIGIGQTPIGELWDKSLQDLAVEALGAACLDAGVEKPDALYVSNMLAGQLIGQKHLGAFIAQGMGWTGIEASAVEAACASGGVAFQAGVRAVASGLMDTVAVCGVEKMTDETSGRTVTAGLATAADADYEVDQGVTFVALNALMMKRYMHEYGVPHRVFGEFSVNAHANGAANPNAMFRQPISVDTYLNAPMIAPPINLFDSSPICDGAAAVILASREVAENLSQVVPVRVLADSTATDCLSLHARRNPIFLDAARASAFRAYEQAGIGPEEVDLFEVHDAFTIMSTLSLEASGFAEPGQGTALAAEGEIRIGGRLPICTMGGLKARGHPVGATGVYEIVDVVTQLRGQAGANQVPDATIGMAQNIGGTGATVVTHILALE